MKLTVITCSTKNCTNTFDHPDTLTVEEVEMQATQNGWTKHPDGTWSGCSKPEGCPCIEQPKEKS